MGNEGSHAFGQGAAGQGLQLTGATVHAALADEGSVQFSTPYPFTHSDFARDGHAPCVQHKVGQGFEMVADQHRVEHQLALAAANVEQLAHGVVALGQCHRVGVHLRQGHAGMAGQGVVGPHDGDDGRDLAVLHLDVTLGRAAVGEANVGFGVEHRLRHSGGGRHAQVELHAGVLLAELGHGLGQKLNRKACRAAHPDQPAPQAL